MYLDSPSARAAGFSIPYTFAQDGEYDIQIYLARGYSGDIDGLKDAQPHEIKLLLDRTPIGEFTVQRPANGDDSLIDRNLKIRVPVTAGPHQRRRHVSQEFLFSDRNGAPAPPVAVQRETSSAHHSGDFPGLRHRTIRAAGCGRYAEPPPDIRLPARLRQRLRRGRPVNGRRDSVRAPDSVHARCGARTVGRFPRRIWNGRWRSIAKEGQNATSMRE